MNNHVTPLLTDLYQVTMAYSFWRDGRVNNHSVFDMFFRVPPFHGAFTIFGGLEQCLKLIQTFRFSAEDIAYFQGVLPDVKPGFWDYLRKVDCSALSLYACPEGTVVFPRVPLLRVEGPLGICQLLETTLLNLCNFGSLIATNAARMRLVTGPSKQLLEFGLRRAQGPDGAMSASRYAFIGGFDGTSNVAAAKEFNIPVKGTHAHSLVCAYASLSDLSSRTIPDLKVGGGTEFDVVQGALSFRKKLGLTVPSMGELAAFLSYAVSFPRGFLALVDTYDTLQSGVPNFLCVALALREAGYSALGIRLDSGDLAYLSKESRKLFAKADALFSTNLATSCRIVASNDLNEEVLISLQEQGNEIDTFAVGTNLVTCSAQPALGMVYKLVEINGEPRIKLSQDPVKITLPGAKEAYRIIGAEGVPLLDVIVQCGESVPAPGKRMLCRHPFDEKKRCYVTPSAVVNLLQLVWKGHRADKAKAAALSGQAGSSSLMAEEDEESLRKRAKAVVGGGGGGSAAAAATDADNDAVISSASAEAAAAAAAAAPAAAAGEGGAEQQVNLRIPFPSLVEIKAYVKSQLELVREDHLRPLNPTPYKVSVSSELFQYIHNLWMKEIPIPELE